MIKVWSTFVCTMESLLLLLAQCSWIFFFLGGGRVVDPLVTGLLYCNVWQFINLLYVCGNVNSWIQVTHEIHDHLSSPKTMMIPLFIGVIFFKKWISFFTIISFFIEYGLSIDYNWIFISKDVMWKRIDKI